VEDVDDTDYNCFAGQLHQFAGDNVYKLPVDHRELMAMVAAAHRATHHRQFPAVVVTRR
jgi:hypothetical protein